ncbi:hypothetical protein PS6_011040 [Mucor atramentarius]
MTKFEAIAKVEKFITDTPNALVAVVDKLHDEIVDGYNGDDFTNYKREWIGAVVEYFKCKKIDVPRSPRPNWENISTAIINRLVSTGYDFQKPGSPVSSARRSSSSSGVSTSADSRTSESPSVKQVKLTQEDKSKIHKLYAVLDNEKMWKLSTGTLVEQQMMKHATSQDYEHLSHSLILDAQDSCWESYFSEQEMDEIRRFRAVNLPVLPFDVKRFLDQLDAIPKHNLYDKVNEHTYAANSDEKWIQEVYNNCFRLTKSGFFPLHDVTEQGIGKRMWSCVDSCFDFSTVKCISGEKCSKASADAANMNRSPSDFSRQQTGRKMDYLFKTRDNDDEIGCGECALVGGTKTTKEFQDAGFKMPKVMRDMMCKIVTRSPGLLHKLCIPGVYIGENVYKLLILDCPAGYVTRYDGFLAVEFPTTENMIRGELPALLTMIMSTRIILENCKQMLDNDDSKPVLGRRKPVVMEPCFVPAGINYKKRKQ